MNDHVTPATTSAPVEATDSTVEVLDASPVAPVEGGAPAPMVPLGVAEPRTRWAGIIWGLVLACMAGTGIWFLVSGFGVEGLTPWVMTFTPFTLGIYVVLVIAALAVITAVVVLVRHAQKTFAARRARP
ncbi:hypothetical protein [Microbacterium sp. YY-03]|uniref:hypothetical protein n=1 Tax=Microbacterium sp. YY-03 TaxID=3421636 RepID=UPI003D162435